MEEIDRQIEQHPLQIISTGQVVKAIILNGLGFVTRLGNFKKKREPKKSKVKNEIKKINLSDDSPGRSAEINS